MSASGVKRIKDSTIANLELAKSEAIKEILSAEDITKADKIRLLEENKLFGTGAYVAHVLEKYETEASSLVGLTRNARIEAGETQRSVPYGRVESFVGCDADKNEIVSMVDVIENMTSRAFDSLPYSTFENFLETGVAPAEAVICVVWVEELDIQIEKNIAEVIDVIYDWCVSTKCTAYRHYW